MRGFRFKVVGCDLCVTVNDTWKSGVVVFLFLVQNNKRENHEIHDLLPSRHLN